MRITCFVICHVLVLSDMVMLQRGKSVRRAPLGGKEEHCELGFCVFRDRVFSKFGIYNEFERCILWRKTSARVPHSGKRTWKPREDIWTKVAQQRQDEWLAGAEVPAAAATGQRPADKRPSTSDLTSMISYVITRFALVLHLQRQMIYCQLDLLFVLVVICHGCAQKEVLSSPNS
jgi:hypothetical protein